MQYAGSDQVVLFVDTGDGAEIQEALDCSEVVSEALYSNTTSVFRELQKLEEKASCKG